MNINTGWTLTFEHPATGKPQTVPAQVPGNVIGDLRRSGVIPDPYFGDNSVALRPYEFIDWTYRTTFAAPKTAPGERLKLHLEGVDTVFTLFVNGKEAGRGENMFIEHVFDVTDLVSAGENELVVKIASSVNAAREFPTWPTCRAQENNYESLPMRRAAHTYGWDIAPRIVGAGLWRKVWLEAEPAERWRDAYLMTCGFEPDGTAQLTLYWDFTTPRKTLDGFSIRLNMKCGDDVFEYAFPVRYTNGCVLGKIRMPSPKLWEPRGWGEPNLYDTNLQLLFEGNVVAERKFRTGIRTVDLVRDAHPEPGVRGKFQFVVNGRKLFVLGSNWVPTDALHGENPERVVRDVDLFAELGCNMIRCWGGGVYEDHDFFDRCDELGILVWQDFMLACERPPQDERFRKLMTIEAESVIRKLRQHPSLALWSGDNECDCVLPSKIPPSSNSITREILPRAVWENDPARDYLPSSPYIHDDCWREPEKFNRPEQHLWGPRDDFKGDYYRHHNAVFASEIGYHGMPSVASMRQFLPEERLNAREGDLYWLCHAAQPFGNVEGEYSYRIRLMINQTRALFGTVPEELAPFAQLSQIVQAEAFKYFIESFRIRKFDRTGIIWWNVIDCWPQFSDAVVDYYYRKKLAFAYIRQSQQSVAMMFDEPAAWHIRLCAVNGTLAARELDYEVIDLDTDAVVLSGHCRAEANSSVTAGKLQMSSGEQKMYLIRWSGEANGVNHYTLGRAPFAPERYLEWLDKLRKFPEYRLPEA